MGVAVVWTLAASEPASGSVRAKARACRWRESGSQRVLLRGAKQDQRADADGVMGVDEDGRRRIVAAEHFQHAAYCVCEKPRPPYSPAPSRRGRRAGQAGDDLARDVGMAVDGDGVDFSLAETAELIGEGSC